MSPLGMKMRWAAKAAACLAVTGSCLGNGFRLDEHNIPPDAPRQSQPKRLTFSAERILAARSMNELAAAAAADGRPLQLILVDSVAAACQDDLRAAARAVDHLQFLTARQNKGEGWDFSKMGTNLASYLVQTVAYIHPSPATLTLEWRYIAQNPDGHYAPSAWPRMGGWQQVMWQTFGAANGWADPSAGMKAMLGEMTELTHEDAPGFFWQGSTALAMEIDPWDQLVLIHEAWKKCRTGDPDVEVARILRASLQLQGCRFRRDIPREADAEWNRRSCGLVKILRDLATTGYAGPPACLAKPGAVAGAQPQPFPSKVQFAVAASITRELSPLVDPVIVEAGIEAGSEALEKDEPTDELAWDGLLAAFNRVPMDERWQTVAGRFLTAFSHKNTPTIRWYPTIANAVDVASRLGDERLLQKVLSRNIGCARSSRQFVTLMRNGHQEAAGNWLKGNLQNLQHRATEENVDAQPGDEAAVERFCETIEKPEQKLLARLLVAVHPQPEENLPRTGIAAGTPRSEEWMARLAEEFTKTEFSDPKVRQVCLRLLADSPCASRILHETLAREAPSISEALQLWEGSNSSLSDSIAVPIARVRNDVAQSDLEAVGKLMQEITSTAPLPAKRTVYDSAVLMVLQRFSRGAATFVPYADAAETARWRDALRDLLTQEQTQRRDETRPIALCQLVALHALTQSRDRLAQWRAELPEAKQQAYAAEIRAYRGRIVSSIAPLFRKEDDDLAPKEKRIQQLIDILRDPWIAAATAQQPDLLHEFCGARIFTHREMIEAAPLLLKECPRGGRTARELAAMAWQTNQRPKGVEFLEAARQAATEPELQTHYAMGALTLTP